MSEQRTAWVDKTAPDLLSYFLRRADYNDAADLVAETIAQIWQSIDRMPVSHEQARMWMFGVARNILRHHYRASSRRGALVEKLHASIIESVQTQSGTQTGMESGLDDALEVRNAISELPDALAEIVRLVYWDGFTLQEVAEHLEIPASTVRSQHARAKSLLRSVLMTSV